jgi:hypothetical protein
LRSFWRVCPAPAITAYLRGDIPSGPGIAKPLVKGKDIEIIAIQLDGLNVYDTDKSQIGKNLFTDPMYQPYADLQALGKQIVAGTTGTGSYSFPATGGGQVVRKQVYWMTVGLHETAWRLVSSWSSGTK